MRYLLLILLLGFHSNCFAQLDAEDETILLQVIRESQPYGKIYYTDIREWNKSTAKKFPALIEERRKFRIEHNYDTAHLITLSDSEKLHLITVLSKKYTWQENLFNHGVRIDKDSLSSYSIGMHKLEERQRMLKEVAKSGDSVLINKVLYAQYAYTYVFDKPVYFRNGSLCLVNISNISQNGGGGTTVSFYKKENGKWVEFWTVCALDN